MVSQRRMSPLPLALVLLSALSRTAWAQDEEFDFPSLTLDPSLTTELLLDFPEPTATSFVEPPTGTGEPCGRIREAIIEWQGDLSAVAVPAELAFECLTSVPITRADALNTLDSITRLVQFQSNLAYLKSPPEGYELPPVDIIGGLGEIQGKVEADEYANEYDFEADIAVLMKSAYDGHLAFDGMTYAGAFRWQRNPLATLVSASPDGGMPAMYLLSDIESGNTSPAPVTEINGEDATAFMLAESDRVPYHDPDTRWNTMFHRSVIETSGFFINTDWYPGPTVDLTLDNGTTLSYTNLATVFNVSSWENIEDGTSFYEAITIVPFSLLTARAESSQLTKRTTQRLVSPSNLRKNNKRSVPPGYPDPFITHPGGALDDVYISGFFLDSATVPDVAVLTIQTFETVTESDTDAFQLLIDELLAECKRRGTRKMIIDVSSNGGGKLLLGYDAFRQFFPETVPYDGSRFRAHDAANILGGAFSQLEFSGITAPAFLSPFNYQFFLDEELDQFTSWNDLFGPVEENGDQYTNTIRLDLTNQYTTQSEDFGVGLSITGYLDRDNIREQPFAAEDIIILSDGICASTCALFVDFMTLDAGVRTFTVGGRPQFGPTQPVGGTKGSQVLFAEQLQAYAQIALQVFPETRRQFREWASVLPLPSTITAYAATINFKDTIRSDSSVPAQFTNETSNCRIFLTPDMVTDVSQLWNAVAEATWGGDDGALDPDRCVPGSAREGGIARDGERKKNGAGRSRPWALGPVVAVGIGVLMMLT